MPQNNESAAYQLNGSAVDEISEKVRTFLSTQKVEKHDALRHSLTIEEILLRYLDAEAASQTVSLKMGTRFTTPYILLSVEGPALNVYTAGNEKNEQAELLNALQLIPEYSYNGRANVYRFHIRKKRANPFVSLIATLVLAVAIGLLGFLLPDASRASLHENVITPLHNTFLNMIGCLAGPMIFFSVAWGIYGIGDVATLKHIGRQLIFRYIGALAFCILLSTVISFLVIRPEISGSNSLGGAAVIFSMILNIVPTDILSPFTSGNTLQIIFMAIVFGFALLFLEQKTRSVAGAVRQFNNIIQFIMESISKLVPYFIFIVIVALFWSDSLSSLDHLGSLFFVFLLSTLISFTCILIHTSVKNRVNPLTLLRKGIPTLIIALTTASSAAAFDTSLRICKKQYGIDESIASFGLPLGTVLFKPFHAVFIVALTVFTAVGFGVDISAEWIVMLLVCQLFISLAAPPIPGGSLAVYAVIFSQLNIPEEAMAIALACDMLVDFIGTGFNQLALPLCLIDQAGKSGLLNREKLVSSASGKR